MNTELEKYNFGPDRRVNWLIGIILAVVIAVMIIWGVK